MALISCKECNKEYSSYALSCPNCGCPTHVNTLKTENFAGDKPDLITSNNYSKQTYAVYSEKKFENIFALLVVLFVLNFVLLFFTPYSEVAKFFTLSLLLFSGVTCGRTCFLISKRFYFSILIGFLGVFNFLNIFVIIWLMHQIYVKKYI